MFSKIFFSFMFIIITLLYLCINDESAFVKKGSTTQKIKIILYFFFDFISVNLKSMSLIKKIQ